MNRFKHFVLVMALFMSIFVLASCSLGAQQALRVKHHKLQKTKILNIKFINSLNHLGLVEPMKNG